MYPRADNARVSEVLGAISAQFKLRYPSNLDFERSVTGTYSGTLRFVLSRILDGYDYVLVFSGEQVDTKVFRTSSRADRPLSSSPVAVSQNAPAPPKTAVSVTMSSQVAPLVPK